MQISLTPLSAMSPKFEPPISRPPKRSGFSHSTKKMERRCQRIASREPGIITSHDKTSLFQNVKNGETRNMEHSIHWKNRWKAQQSHGASQIRSDKSAKSCLHGQDKVEVLCPVNGSLRVAMDFHSYRLVDGLTHYDERVAKPLASWVSTLQFQMKSHLLSPVDRVSIIRFPWAFKMLWDSSGVQKRAATAWLLYLGKSELQLLQNTCFLNFRSSHRGVGEGMFISYADVVSHPLETFSMNEIIAGACTKIVHFIQPRIRSPLQYTDGLCMRTWSCPQLYHEYVQNRTLVRGLL